MKSSAMPRPNVDAMDGHDELVASFVRALNWPNPRKFEHGARFNEQEGPVTRLVWFETGEIGDNRTDCFLQVNRLGCNNRTVLCSAAVYAPRFRICTGWHPVRLSNHESAISEAERLRDWFDRKNY
jgi:hypothetical protein